MRITGDAELLRKLNALPVKVQRRVVGVALSAGAGPILAAARAATGFRDRTGMLRSHIKMRLAAGKRKDTRLVVVGPVHAKRFFRRTATGKLRGVSAKKAEIRRKAGQAVMAVDPGNYGYLVERGHRLKRGGSVPPHQFLTPAFRASAQAAVAKVEAKLIEGVQREVGHA